MTYATPLFWVGLMFIVVFSLNLGWFPTSGMENIAAFYEGWDRVWDVAHHLVLPTVTLSLFYLALYTRLMRASMLEQAGMDYVTTARAKGLTERRIMFVHVPSVWMAMGAYMVMVSGALGVLVWRHPLADVAARSAAPIGAAFTFLGLATGSIWGRAVHRWSSWGPG